MPAIIAMNAATFRYLKPFCILFSFFSVDSFLIFFTFFQHRKNRPRCVLPVVFLRQPRVYQALRGAHDAKLGVLVCEAALEINVVRRTKRSVSRELDRGTGHKRA